MNKFNASKAGVTIYSRKQLESLWEKLTAKLRNRK